MRARLRQPGNHARGLLRRRAARRPTTASSSSRAWCGASRSGSSPRSASAARSPSCSTWSRCACSRSRRPTPRALVREFPGAGALGEFRGRAALPEDAVVEVLMALAGPDGLATRLGDELVELECNPVLVTPTGARRARRPPHPARRTRRARRRRRSPTSPACSRRVPSRSPARRRRGAVSATARSPRTARSVGATISTRCIPTPTEIDGVRAVRRPRRGRRADRLPAGRGARRTLRRRRARHGGAGAVRARDQRRLRRGRCRGRGVERRAARGRARGEDPRDRPELHRRVQPRRATGLPAERAAATSAA